MTVYAVGEGSRGGTGMADEEGTSGQWGVHVVVHGLVDQGNEP